MTERRDILPREDIAPQDRDWFDRTCRAQARRVLRHRPDLWEDGEGEARLAAWVAYRDGKHRGIVTQEAWQGAHELWVRATRRKRYGRVAPAPLTVPGGDGGDGEGENPALYLSGRVAPSPERVVLARECARALVALLPARDAALVARIAAGEDCAAIAAERGRSVSAVYMAHHRALRRLRASPEAQAWFSP